MDRALYRVVVEFRGMRGVCVGRDGCRFHASRGGRASKCLNYLELVTDEGIEVVVGIIVVGKVDVDVIDATCGGVLRVYAGDVVVVDED